MVVKLPFKGDFASRPIPVNSYFKIVRPKDAGSKVVKIENTPK